MTLQVVNCAKRTTTLDYKHTRINIQMTMLGPRNGTFRFGDYPMAPSAPVITGCHMIPVQLAVHSCFHVMCVCCFRSGYSQQDLFMPLHGDGRDTDQVDSRLNYFAKLKKTRSCNQRLRKCQSSGLTRYTLL